MIGVEGAHQRRSGPSMIGVRRRRGAVTTVGCACRAGRMKFVGGEGAVGIGVEQAQRGRGAGDFAGADDAVVVGIKCAHEWRRRTVAGTRAGLRSVGLSEGGGDEAKREAEDCEEFERFHFLFG